jgi:hypothetical protein
VITADFDLVGRYFVISGDRDTSEEGWVRRNVGSGFYIVEVFILTTEGFETALKVKHFVELRDAFFYKDPPAAQRDHDAQFIRALQPIDLETIRQSACDELEGLVLDELRRSVKKGNVDEISRLKALLKGLGNSRF